MKRFILFFLFTTLAVFGLDAATHSGFADDLAAQVERIDLSDVGVLGMSIAAVSAIVPGEVDSVKSKLWVIPKAEFESMQAKYRHLYIIDVTFGSNERYQFISRRPTREVIQAVGESVESPFKITDIMIKNMIVAGNMEALDDGTVYSHVSKQLAGIVKDGKALFTKA